MISLKSAGIGAGLITGVAGLTCGIGYSTGLFNSKELSNPNTQISKLLDRENKYALLSTETGDDEGWKAAWKRYKDDNQSRENGQDKWKVSGWTKADVTNIPQGFKSKCSEKKDIQVPSVEAPEYIEFSKYCTRPKTVQEILEKEGFSPLQDGEQDANWKAKIEKYKTSNNQLPEAKISSSTSSPDFNVLKNGCKKALALKATENSYNATISPAREWCGA